MSEKRNLDFEPIRETWNKYRLENGVIIRSKFYISQIIETSGINPVFDFKINNQVEVQDLSIEKITMPLVQEPINITREDLEKVMKFEVMANKPQIYELDNSSFLFIYEKMNKIWSTKRKNVYGKTIYHLEANASINIYKPNP